MILERLIYDSRFSETLKGNHLNSPKAIILKVFDIAFQYGCGYKWAFGVIPVQPVFQFKEIVVNRDINDYRRVADVLYSNIPAAVRSDVIAKQSFNTIPECAHICSLSEKCHNLIPSYNAGGD